MEEGKFSEAREDLATIEKVWEEIRIEIAVDEGKEIGEFSEAREDLATIEKVYEEIRIEIAIDEGKEKRIIFWSQRRFSYYRTSLRRNQNWNSCRWR